MTLSKNSFMTVTLMITIAIDIMGMGLVFPVMPDLIFDKTHGLLLTPLSSVMENLYYGLLMAIWPVGLFVGAPYFGDMSDKIGRKWVIAFCLLGTVFAFWACAVAVRFHWFWAFIVFRFFSGLFGGNFTIAQAMMIDISTPETKAKNLSRVTLAASLGFVVGPLITSVSTLPGVSGAFTLMAPFGLAGIIALINTLGVCLFLPKNPPANPQAKLRLLKGFIVLQEVLTDTRTRAMLVVLLLMNAGWGFYCGTMPLLLHQLYHYSSSLTALFFAMLAVGNVIGTVFVQPWTLQVFSMRRAGVLMAAILTVLIALSLWTVHPYFEWAVVVLAGPAQLIFYTVAMTMLSNKVEAFEQGKAMGGAGAAVSASWVLTGLLTGVFIDSSILLPIKVGAVVLLGAGLFFYYNSVE